MNDIGDVSDRYRSARGRVARLSREQVVALLTAASIQCYDEESVEVLREALLANVQDGTIPLADIPE